MKSSENTKDYLRKQHEAPFTHSTSTSTTTGKKNLFSNAQDAVMNEATISLPDNAITADFEDCRVVLLQSSWCCSTKDIHATTAAGQVQNKVIERKIFVE